MFNIGFGELAVICIVLIIAVGPERLPSMMKSLGKTIRTLRQASRDIRASTGIDELLREDFDLYAPIKPSPKPAPSTRPATAPKPASQSEPGALPQPQAADHAAEHATESAASASAPVSREESLGAKADAAEADANDVAGAVAEDGARKREAEALPADRPSVVVAPPPQAVGTPAARAEPAEVPPQPSAGKRPAGAVSPPAGDTDTLPRAAVVHTSTSAHAGVASAGPQAPPPAGVTATAPDAAAAATADPTTPMAPTSEAKAPQKTQDTTDVASHTQSATAADQVAAAEPNASAPEAADSEHPSQGTGAAADRADGSGVTKQSGA